MSLWRWFLASSLIWVAFVCGWVGQDLLRDWLVRAHSGSLLQQLAMVGSGAFRVFLTCALLSVTVLVCMFLALAVVALLNELWYQFFQRKIVNILAKQRERRNRELQRAAEEDDEDDEGAAPREPVNARRHATRGRAAPKQSLLPRLMELQQQAAREVESESSSYAAEMEVTNEH